MAVERKPLPGEAGYALTTLEAMIAWGRKYSIYPFTFATAFATPLPPNPKVNPKVYSRLFQPWWASRMWRTSPANSRHVAWRG